MNKKVEAETYDERQKKHYATARVMNRLLFMLEKDGAINADERFSLVDLRKALDQFTDDVMTFEDRIKQSGKTC